MANIFQQIAGRVQEGLGAFTDPIFGEVREAEKKEKELRAQLEARRASEPQKATSQPVSVQTGTQPNIFQRLAQNAPQAETTTAVAERPSREELLERLERDKQKAQTRLTDEQVGRLHEEGFSTIGQATGPKLPPISTVERLDKQQDAFEQHLKNTQPELFNQIRIPFTKGGKAPDFLGGKPILVSKTDPLTPLLSSFAEGVAEFIPGLIKSIPQAQDIARTGKLPRPTEETRVESPLDIGGSVADFFVEKGVSPDKAEILGGGLGLGIGIIDAFFTRSLGRGFTRAVLRNVAVPDEVLQIAWQKLGSAGTKEQALKTAKDLLREVSPNSSKAQRQGTVDEALARDITDARTIIQEKGIPTTPSIPATALRNFARTLEADVRDLATRGLGQEIQVPFVRPAGLLPGTRPAGGRLQPRLGLQTESIEPVGRGVPKKGFDPLKSTSELENQLVKTARKGTGKFEVGEVYQQVVMGKPRPVIISKVNPDGSVEGFYMGAISETEQAFGIGMRSLQPAKWNRPQVELKTADFSQDRLDEFVSKVFAIEKPKQVTGATTPARAIPDELAQEADKAIAKHPNNLEKAQEEFVRKQPIVYHGSPVPLKQFSNKKGGVFFTDEYADATGFAGTPDNVYEGFLNFKKPLVIDAKGAKWDELNTKYGKSTQEIVANAEKEGFDGVTFKNIVDNIGDTAGFGGQSTIHYAFKPRDAFLNESQLTDIVTQRFNQAVRGGVPEAGGRVAGVTPEVPRVTIEPAIQPGTPLSRHFERTKPGLDALADGAGFERINIEDQARRSFELIEKSPNKALRIAYGIDAPPAGLHKEAVQISLVESLRAAGKTEQALMVARRASLALTDTAQKLNLAKLDLGSAGARRIEGILLDEKLAKIGKGIPATPGAIEAKARGLAKIRADATKAVRESFETTKLGRAEGLLDDIKVTGATRSALAKGFAKDNITINRLFEMTSAERRSTLAKYVGEDEAKALNTSFEKALVSRQKQALSNWVWKNLHDGKSLYGEVEIEQAQKMFNAGLKATDLKKMTPDQRIARLSEFVGHSNAEKLNTRFESAVQAGTLANWEQRVIGSKALFENQKIARGLTRMQMLDDMGLLTPARAEDFMQDLVSLKLGLEVTPEQAKQISGIVKKVGDAFERVGDDWTHLNREAVTDYFVQRKALADFMKKVNPDSAIDVFTGTGARGAILFSFRSALNSFMFQIIPGITRAITKRVVSGFLVPGDFKFIDRMTVTASGLLRPIHRNDFWLGQMKMGVDIYRKTGFDVSRMQTLEDGFRFFGEKITSTVGPTFGESKGVAAKFGSLVRLHGRLMEPGLKYAAGGTDAFFGSAHRAGTTSLLARQTAALEARAGILPPGVTQAQREMQLIKEAMSFNPQSVQAQYIREMGITDAHQANFTANDAFGRLALAMRNAIPAGIGKTIAPFAKIPANALQKGFEASGPGLIMGAQRVVKAMKLPEGAARNTEIAEGITTMITSGGLLGAAIFFTSQLDNDDYIQPYDFTARSENNLTITKNAGANYVRIGGNWVNLRWFGPLSLPISGIMMGRQNRARGESFGVGYMQGVGAGVLDFPVIKEFFGVGKNLESAVRSGTFTSFMKDAGIDMESMRRWWQVRLVPSIISHDVQGLVDETKYDAFGRPRPGKEWKNFFVGANVKEDTSNSLTKEFDRLSVSGNLPTLTDPTGVNADFLQFVAESTDDKMYINFLNELKQNYAVRVLAFTRTQEYLKLSDEEKKSEIDKIRRSEILDRVQERSKQLQKELGIKGVTPERLERMRVGSAYNRNTVGTISAYARAFTTDPGNAWKAFTTQEKLGVVEGNLVELQRFYGIHFTDVGGSQEVKKRLMAEMGLSWDERDKYKLEHITPVKAGGGSEDENLMIVDKARHDFFTPIDIAVGFAVKDRKITRQQAEALMKGFKVEKRITAEQIMQVIR